ncbi:hypothetical protein TNCV_92181 [Trichonephila clavipes]|nr:hypothetical protein TNCV_92181 [Trichonephila clavipes]
MAFDMQQVASPKIFPTCLIGVAATGALRSLFSYTRGLLTTDHVILNPGQVTWMTPELAPPSPNYHTTSMGGRFSSRQREPTEQQTEQTGDKLKKAPSQNKMAPSETDNGGKEVLGSNPEEGLNVCECIVLNRDSSQEITNWRRVEGEPEPLRGCSSSKLRWKGKKLYSLLHGAQTYD